MNKFLMFVLWFVVASILDAVLRYAALHLPDRYRWLRLDGAAFALVLWIGVHIGRHYNGWWTPF